MISICAGGRWETQRRSLFWLKWLEDADYNAFQYLMRVIHKTLLFKDAKDWPKAVSLLESDSELGWELSTAGWEPEAPNWKLLSKAYVIYKCPSGDGLIKVAKENDIYIAKSWMESKKLNAFYERNEFGTSEPLYQKEERIERKKNKQEEHKEWRKRKGFRGKGRAWPDKRTCKPLGCSVKMSELAVGDRVKIKESSPSKHAGRTVRIRSLDLTHVRFREDGSTTTDKVVRSSVVPVDDDEDEQPAVEPLPPPASPPPTSPPLAATADRAMSVFGLRSNDIFITP